MRLRLKLMAPFALRGFDLNIARILQAPAKYGSAWEQVASSVNNDLAEVPGLAPGMVLAHAFTHASRFSREVGSRYQTIAAHSLPRALHAFEIIGQIPGRLEPRLLSVESDSTSTESGQAPEEVARRVEETMTAEIRQLPPKTLIRGFGHGVGLFEMDLPLPPALFNEKESSVGPIGDRLDALQQFGIALTERMVERFSSRVLEPLFDWLSLQRAFREPYLRLRETPARGVDPTRSRTLWVTRTLIVEKREMPTKTDSTDSRQGPLHAIVGHWLKDVSDAQQAIRECRESARASSTSWLNYFFREETYPGEYPTDGWRGGGIRPDSPTRQEPRDWETPRSPNGRYIRAAPFCPVWDAMLIAQYYYAAFDVLQSKISRILAISVAGEGRRSVAQVKASLDGAVRDADMLKVEFEENGKYYSRQVEALVERILDNWGFQSKLRKQIDQRIEDCVKRLRELHSRALEQSSIYTDLILLAIGVTAVFEVLLYLAEYGRTMSADPDLSVYDRTSWNIANWIGASSTDVILLAGAVFSIGLTLLYAYFRTSKSRV